MIKSIMTFFILLMVMGCSRQSNNNDDKYIIGYFFPRDSVAVGDEIAVEKMTHINYAFANIIDGKIAEGFKNDSLNFIVINETKKRNPEMKLLVSVGGWTWSGQFSDMALTEASRAKFIKSAVNFIKLHNLDGIDLDWEFPGLEGYGNIHRPADKQNFTQLLKELREALNSASKQKNKPYLLTIAAAAFDDYLANVEMEKLHNYIDFINIMAYDMYESDYDTIAGHHTALFSNPLDKKDVSADAAVQKILNAGVPPEKIVLGVAFYGRTFQTVSSNNHGLFQPAGPVKERIRASFKNIKSNLLKAGFVRYWDSVSCAPYLFSDKQNIFISYDDEQSLREKCNYIKLHNLKGAMFWEYHSDLNSILLNTLYTELENKNNK